jgi:uncharacterized protein
MPSAWSGSVGQLKSKIENGLFLDEMKNGFENAFQKPTNAEIQSWSISIPEFLYLLEKPIFDGIQIILELQMPIGAERADVVLLGGTDINFKAIIIELKQWSEISLNPVTHEVNVPGLGLHQHPSIQVLNYAGKLHFFNSRAHDYQISSVVFLQNFSKMDKDLLSSEPFHAWIDKAPLYTLGDSIPLESFISNNLLPINLPINEHIDFSNAPYDQSNHLFSFLQEHADDIARDSALAIAATGMGLTDEQERIKNEVISALLSHENKDFIIQGLPGSGKTLLAVSLLLKAAERKIPTALALRNNRLQAILREIFDTAYPGASGMMMFFEPRQGIGIARFEGHIDLLICDEAQRMESRIMPNVLSKCDVSAIFLDESQRLNPPEQGTSKNFSSASSSLGRTPVLRSLSTSVRIPIRYSEWVENLLANSPVAQLKNDYQTLKYGYLFNVFNDVGALLEKLSQLRSPQNRVALVASFTESPGNNTVDHPDNLRVGYPLTSGFDLYKNSNVNIPWLMSTNHYKQFWIGGRSNNLDRIASIYGCQGFENDYVGVIWGRDFIYRKGEWTLGDPNYSYDGIDRLITGKTGNHKWNNSALELMVNRYRVFLTRGIKGTFIFCEDEETQAHLQSCVYY